MDEPPRSSPSWEDFWHAANAIERVELKVDAYTQTSARNEAMIQAWVPETKRLMGAVEGIVIQMATHAAQEIQVADGLDRLGRSLDRFDSRLDALDKRQDLIERTADQHQHQIHALQERAAAVRPLTDRVDTLERRHSDAALIVVATGKERVRIFTLARVGFAAVVAVVAFVGSQLGHLADWLRK